MAKPTCFIIAPITTPPERVQLYRGDEDHCRHVIDHLLIPAVERAELQPIPPIAKGADLIHAGIIKNLQEADLVLCDMSGLNPNVFFELGMRTALNKPVCIILDETTDRTPFDLSTINNHTYDSELAMWKTPAEIEKLATHLRESADAKDNALWKYFALRLVAGPVRTDAQPADKLDLLLAEVAALRKDSAVARRALVAPPSPDLAAAVDKWAKQREAEEGVMKTAIEHQMSTFGFAPGSYGLSADSTDKMVVITSNDLRHDQQIQLARKLRPTGWQVVLATKIDDVSMRPPQP